MAKFRVSAEFTVAGDRDPNVWDWETILDIEDESDHVDWSTFTLERVADDDVEPTCDYCGVGQYHSEDMDWDGDTGCHVACQSDVKCEVELCRNVATEFECEEALCRDCYDAVVECEHNVKIDNCREDECVDRRSPDHIVRRIADDGAKVGA